MDRSTRERLVRNQKDAMGHFITASDRKDKKNMAGALNEVVRAGRAMGIRPSTLDPSDRRMKR